MASACGSRNSRWGRTTVRTFRSSAGASSNAATCTAAGWAAPMRCSARPARWSSSPPTTFAKSSHPPETMLKRAADGQYVRPAAHRQLQLAVVAFLDGIDGGDAHDHAAVDLPERFRIERRRELLQRRADVALAHRRDHARVFV